MDKIDPNTGEVLTQTGGALVPQAAPGALTTEQLAKLRRNAGKQKFTVKELVIPQFKIVQANTYAKKSSKDYVEGAEEGDLIDTLSLQPRKAPISILVVRFATTYMEAQPNMGPIVKLWGEDPTGYERAQGGDVGTRITAEGNEINASASYHCLMLGDDGSSMPCMMYVGGTSWKEAKRLNTLIGTFELMSEDGPFIAPPYARVYTVNTVPMANEKNSWMGWKFGVGPLTTSRKYGDALYDKAVQFEESIDKGIVKVHGPVEDEREMGRANAGTRRPVRDSGVGPNRGEEPPTEAYEADMAAKAATQDFS